MRIPATPAISDAALPRPSAVRGRAVDAAVRLRLAASLRSLAVAASGRIPCAPDAIHSLADAVTAHPVRPAVMAHYTEAVSAIAAGDAPAAAASLAALADPALCAPATPRTVTLRAEDLGPALGAYARLLDEEEGGALGLLPVDAVTLAAAPARIEAALGLLGPDLAGEIRALVPEIVLVRSAPEAALRFDGTTTFYLWGAIALNLGSQATDVALAQALAHESGHALLFGLTLGGRMVENPDEDRFASPLREDPRPMEGLVHAAFVLARMHLSATAMLDGRALDAAQRAEAAAARAQAEADYRAALPVIRAHARFTEAGGCAFALAEGHMG